MSDDLRFYLKLYELTGTVIDRFSDVLEVAYVRERNRPGYLAFTVHGDHRLISELQDKYIVELWVASERVPARREFTGIFRRPRFFSAETETFTAYCPGDLSLLGWRSNAYYAGVSGRSKYTNIAPETIAKLLVRQNITAGAATTNGRARSGTGWPAYAMSVAEDLGRGEPTSWYCAQDHLLTNLQELAGLTGASINLDHAAGAFAFQWYLDQIGTDRSSGATAITFSRGLGNLTNIEFEEDRLEVATAAVVWGQGEGTERDVEVVVSSEFSRTNDIEVAVFAPDVDKGDRAGLRARGQAALEKMRAVPSFSFDVVQTEGCSYLEHYFWGDRVTVINPYTGAAYAQIVSRVAGSWKAGQAFQVDIGLESV